MDIRANFPNPERIKEMEKEIKFVPMGGMDVTSAADQKPVIGTTSLASCAGVAIYDPEHRVGGIAHVFFNEKESIVEYMHDVTGKPIPSTGRGVIVTNPRPFEPFQYLVEALVKKAENIGGVNFDFYAFNIDFGSRTSEQNLQLKAVAERTIKKLQDEKKIKDVKWRHEQDFKLDTRTGTVLPYYQ